MLQVMFPFLGLPATINETHWAHYFQSTMNNTFFTQISNLSKHDCSYSCAVPLVFWRAGSALPITLSELVEDNNSRMKAGFLCHCCWKPAGHSTPQWSRPANESVVSFLPSLGVMVHAEVMNAGLSVRLWEQGRNVWSPFGSFMTRRGLEQGGLRCRWRSVEEPLRKEGVTRSPLKVSWRYLCLTAL